MERCEGAAARQYIYVSVSAAPPPIHGGPGDVQGGPGHGELPPHSLHSQHYIQQEIKMQEERPGWQQEMLMLADTAEKVGERRTLSFDTTQETFTAWHTLGQERSLSDSQLAAFLLQCYKDVVEGTVCSTCQSPLTHVCSNCFVLVPVSRQEQPVVDAPTLTTVSEQEQPSVDASALTTVSEQEQPSVDASRFTTVSEQKQPVVCEQVKPVVDTSVSPTESRYQSEYHCLTENSFQLKFEQSLSTIEVVGLPSTSQLVELPSTSQLVELPSTSQLVELSSTSQHQDSAGEAGHVPCDDTKAPNAKCTDSGNTVVNWTEVKTPVCSETETEAADPFPFPSDAETGSEDLFPIPSQTAEKPHIVGCALCNVSYESTKHLANHMQTHTTFSWQRLQFPVNKSSSRTVRQSRSTKTLNHQTFHKDHPRRNPPRTHKRTRAEKSWGKYTEATEKEEKREELLWEPEETDSQELFTAKGQRKDYVCLHCGNRYAKMVHFTNHLQKHLKKKFYRCCTCQATFTTMLELARHLRAESHDLVGTSGHEPPELEDPVKSRYEKIVDKKRPYMCAVCGMRFTHLRYLDVHGEQHPNFQVFWCSQCQRKFKTLTDFTGHQCCSAAVFHPDHSKVDGVLTEQSQEPEEGQNVVVEQSGEGQNVVVEQSGAGQNVVVERSESQGGETTSAAVDVLLEEAAEGGPSSKQSDVTPPEEVQESCTVTLIPTERQSPDKGQSSIPEAQVSELQKVTTGEGTAEADAKEESKAEKGSVDEVLEESEKEQAEQRARKQGKNGCKVMRKTSHNLRFSCPDCPAIFTSSVRLKIHSQKHTGQAAFPCPQCELSFTSTTKLLDHETQVHWGANPITCTHCGKVVSTLRCLKDHLNSHTGDKPYTCLTCGETFGNNAALNRHRHKHRDWYQCRQCPASFYIYSSYKAHMEMHAGVKRFLCPTCGEAFLNKSGLVRHQVKHGQKQFICDQCGKTFHNKDSYKRHQGTHLKVRPFACHLCPKTFLAKNKLHLHHSRVHLKLRPHKCKLCEAAYATPARLKEHFRATHTTDRPYACPTCGKTFAKSTCRQAHLRTHKGPKASL